MLDLFVLLIYVEQGSVVDMIMVQATGTRYCSLGSKLCDYFNLK